MQVVNFNLVQIHLNAGLHLIAPVVEQQRFILQYQRDAGRTVKARQPGQFFIIRRAVFTLPGIRARDDHPVEMAGLKPSDVDVVGLYDAFTINTLLFLEDLGFCKKGEAGAFVQNGGIAPGGRLPVNTNGGGLSCVHPGMYGIFLVIEAVRQDMKTEDKEDAAVEAMLQDDLQYYNALPKMPQGVRESISAVGPHLAMPAIFAITPAIGMLATGVRVLIHGKPSQLNLISYIAGDFASGKGSIDPIVAAWLAEVKMVDKGYLQAEEEWRARKRAAKNKKEQPEDPKYPVRCLTLNTTVANLADRLANTQGKHAFSFTPEADTVAQKWRTAMCDFSVMLRQAYDGTPYDREAKSAEAVNVHIDKLLWNVVMCGTPDALYRVITNYTDGFQSRVAVARTPDNTFSALAESPYRLTEQHRAKIQQVAHLLPLMSGDVELPKLEKRGRQWLERIRIETLENDDKTKARQRFRTCPTAMRMMTCLMLCRVAERLINSYGMQGAETRLKGDPTLWQKLILRQQTPQMLAAFDVLADYMIDNAMLFFRERIETAFRSGSYVSSGKARSRKSKNDSIYEELADRFTTEEAYGVSVGIRGGDISNGSVRTMLSRWEQQGMVERLDRGVYKKSYRQEVL